MRAVAFTVAVLALAGCREVAVDAGATRPLEVRLSGADRYRPLQAGHQELPLSDQATLERRGAWPALAAAALQAGRFDAAEAALRRAPATPAVDADAAALLYMRGDLEAALERVTRVLERAPALGAARWNRALILRQLGLQRLAAAGFDDVAALGEPGWAGEARAQAASLRATMAERERAWKDATSAGRAMVATGALPPASVRQAYPSYMRHFFYHALRAAPSLERVRALAPLAAELDALDGGDLLRRRLAETAAKDLARRAPLAAEYARIVPNPKVMDRAAADAYLAALRKAGDDDLLLGALLLFNRRAEHLDEMLRLARATGDPWYRAVAADLESDRMLNHERVVEAESLLLTTLAECNARKLDFRCVYLESPLTRTYILMHRTDDADRVARSALTRARAQAPSREFELLERLGEAARERMSFALMQGYLDESVRSLPDFCQGRRDAYEQMAVARLFAFDRAGARKELDRAPRCQQPITLVRAYVLANLAQSGHAGPEAATLSADIDAARPTLPPGMRAEIDVYRARLAMSKDRAAGEQLLDQALAEAAALPHDAEAQKARAYANNTRAFEGAYAGDAAKALAALAADVGAPLPARCALGVGIDDEAAMAVARGPGGELRLHVDRHRKSPAIEAAALVPAPLREALAGCEQIAVFAPPPVNGLPGLLPPELAWSYRVAPPSAASSAAASSPALAQRRVVVANPTPPASLRLPPLADWRLGGNDAATVIEAAAATPARVLAEIADATEVEVHAHGLVNLGLSDASVLALTPEPSGRFALSARDIAKSRLRGRPIVILGACRAAQAANYLHEPWGLPLAFVEAGARAVLASPQPIADAGAGPFFSAVLSRIHAGVAPAVALRDARTLALSRDPGSWVSQLLVFE